MDTALNVSTFCCLCSCSVCAFGFGSGFGWCTLIKQVSASRLQIYKGDPRPRIPARVITSSAMGLKLGVFRFLPTTHTETHANKMCPRSSRAVRHFTCVYFHTQTAVHTHLTNHGYFDRRKTPNTPNLSPMPGWKWRRFWDLPCISVITSEVSWKLGYDRVQTINLGDNTLEM